MVYSIIYSHYTRDCFTNVSVNDMRHVWVSSKNARCESHQYPLILCSPRIPFQLLPLHQKPIYNPDQQLPTQTQRLDPRKALHIHRPTETPALGAPDVEKPQEEGGDYYNDGCCRTIGDNQRRQVIRGAQQQPKRSQQRPKRRKRRSVERLMYPPRARYGCDRVALGTHAVRRWLLHSMRVRMCLPIERNLRCIPSSSSPSLCRFHLRQPLRFTLKLLLKRNGPLRTECIAAAYYVRPVHVFPRVQIPEERKHLVRVSA